jgi:hypothetical protein
MVKNNNMNTFSSEMELIRVILIDAMSGKIMVAHQRHTSPQASNALEKRHKHSIQRQRFVEV